MHSMTRRPPGKRLLLTLALLAPVMAFADYSGNPRAAELKRILADEYAFSGADLVAVDQALRKAERVPRLIEKEQTAKEKTLTWTGYRPIHVNDANVRRGVAFMNEYESWLERAHREYGVAPAVIAAILGVETKFGGYTGPHRVLDALSTQGFEHPTRSDFFFSELVAFFVLCHEQQRQPEDMLGSYAGAMGAAQFMPSNYRRLAVDFDGDGDTDLWSLPDAIGSIANYLIKYRPQVAWQRDQPLIAPLQPTTGFRAPADAVNTKLPSGTLGQLRESGAHIDADLDDATAAGILELKLDSGQHEYWAGLNNFYAVMSYNPRVYYAMSVTQLAEALSQARSEQAAR